MTQAILKESGVYDLTN